MAANLKDKVNRQVQIASYRILKLITLRKQAQYLKYASAAVALAAIPQGDVPATVAAVAGGLGVEALGDLLSKLAGGREVAEEEIVRVVEKAVSESGLEKLLASNQALEREITQLASWRQQFEYVVERDQEMAVRLLEQYKSLAADVAGIREELPKLATRAQSEVIQQLLEQILDHLTTPTGTAIVKSAAGALPIINPFGIAGRIENPARYVVRRPFTGQVMDELRKGVSLSIVGESQTGKSSLLWHIASQGPAALGRAAADFVYLSLELVNSDDEFFEYVCGELGVATSRGYRLARALGQRRVVLCLDEVERMKRSSYRGFSLEFRSELRGLADGPGAPLTLVIASRSPLDRLFPDSPELTSPLAGLCTPMAMPAFSLAETQALVQQYVAGTGLALPEGEV